MPARKKRLEWTKTALTELAEGMTFYAERNPDAARRMHQEINKAALSLISPKLPANGRPGRVPGTRELVLGKRTFYTIIFQAQSDGASISILSIMHHARKYP